MSLFWSLLFGPYKMPQILLCHLASIAHVLISPCAILASIAHVPSKGISLTVFILPSVVPTNDWLMMGS